MICHKSDSAFYIVGNGENKERKAQRMCFI